MSKSDVCAVSIRCATQQSNIHWWLSSNAATECVGSSLQQVRTTIMAKNCCLLSCNISSVVRLMLVDHSLQVWWGASCQPPVCLPYMPDGDRKIWETAEIRAWHVCQGKPSNHTLTYYESSQSVCTCVCMCVCENKIRPGSLLISKNDKNWFTVVARLSSNWNNCQRQWISLLSSQFLHPHWTFPSPLCWMFLPMFSPPACPVCLAEQGLPGGRVSSHHLLHQHAVVSWVGGIRQRERQR